MEKQSKKEYLPPLMKRTPNIYKESFLTMAEALRKRFKKGRNPVDLMITFCDAVDYKLPIPEWVIDKLNEVFELYLYGDTFEKAEDRSLDRLLNISGRGQRSIKTRLEKHERDIRIMMDIDMMRQLGVGPKDAAKIAYNYNKGSFSPNVEKLRQDYHSWKRQFNRELVYDEPKRLKALLESAAGEIRIKKKYRRIFDIQSK